MKPHYRLHFHLFDGKTPLWWVSRKEGYGALARLRTTNGYVDCGTAIREAARL